MSIISDRNTRGQNLQEIIDSYNDELMRLHRRSMEAESAPASADRRADEVITPRENNAAINSDRNSDRKSDRFAVGWESQAQSASEREQWLKDLEDGLEELRKGLIELAKGQKELNDGLNEWREGMTQAVPASAEADSDGNIAWLRQLEDGMEELRRGMAELAKGQKELNDGLNERREELMTDIPDKLPAYLPTADNMPVSSEITSETSAAHMHGTVLPSEPPVNAPLDDIVANPSGSGMLCVAVNAARSAVPVAGASVTVTLPVSDYELLYSFVSTDGSGRSPEIELPVYEADLSEHVQSNADIGSYTPEYRTYRVRVQAAGFRLKDDLTAEIFDGISSTLNVELEPLSGQNGSRSDTGGNNQANKENISGGRGMNGGEVR